MKRQCFAKTFGLTGALVLGASLSAMAGLYPTVDLQFTWSGSLYQSGFTGNYIQSDDAIGIYAFNSSGNNSVPNPLYSVCLSPAGLLDESEHTYNIIPFSAANPGIYPSAWAWNNSASNPQYWGVNNAAYLWNKYGMAIVNGTIDASDPNAAGAALEFAIWTALYNSQGYGTLGGSVWTQPTLSGDTLTDYNYFIKALDNSGITGPQYTGNILEGQEAISGGADSGQSQEFFMLGTPVPEPTTMVAGALLLLPFGASTLRMLRRNRNA